MNVSNYLVSDHLMIFKQSFVLSDEMRV